METEIKKTREKTIQEKQQEGLVLYNPEGTNYEASHAIKCIECTDEYTRIDFIYKSPSYYINGGWVQIERNSFIRPVGSEKKYTLIQAINIPIAPTKHFFKRSGEYLHYTLLFPALPKSTRKIDIIEKEAAGTYFNFYDINFSKWMTIPHAGSQVLSNN
jgi:hypothetical protein